MGHTCFDSRYQLDYVYYYCFRLAYLWRASKGLFPEIYMSSKAKYTPVKEYIRGQVNETLRVWAKYSTPDTLILPYSLCQDTGTDFFSKVRSR